MAVAMAVAAIIADLIVHSVHSHSYVNQNKHAKLVYPEKWKMHKGEGTHSAQ